MEIEIERSTMNITKVSDLVKATYKQDFAEMIRLFDIMTEKESEKQKIGLCRHLFTRISFDNYTFLVRLILNKIPKNRIRAIFVQQEDEIIAALKRKVNYQEIAEEMKNNDSLDVLGAMLDTIDFIDARHIIKVMPDPELLLALNTKRFAQIYIDEYLNDSPEEILIFLKMNEKRLPINWVYAQYIDLIIKSEEFRNESVERLIAISRQNLQERKRTIQHADIIKLTLGLNNEDFYLVDKIVQQGTKYSYSIQPMKRYAQLDLDKEKSLNPFKELLEKKIPAKHIIYIYMNTRLRENVQLNQLIEEMIIIGYTETEVLNIVRDYWIVGRVKHVTEDGIVRVSADSLSVSRLMTFNSNLIHISGKDGEWVLPKEGNTIYFKIRNYLNGGKFYIHYPCEKIEYVLKEEKLPEV